VPFVQKKTDERGFQHLKPASVKEVSQYLRFCRNPGLPILKKWPCWVEVSLRTRRDQGKMTKIEGKPLRSSYLILVNGMSKATSVTKLYSVVAALIWDELEPKLLKKQGETRWERILSQRFTAIQGCPKTVQR
jgi:hypothetical protein